MEPFTLRPDGRRPDELRKPIIKYDILNNNCSLQYQAGENLLIVQLSYSNNRKLKLFINQQTQFSHISNIEIIHATTIISQILQKILKPENQRMQINVDILSCDRGVRAHIFNAIVCFLCLSGFEFISLPVAVSALCKNNQVLLDDQQTNFLLIADKNSCFHFSAVDLRPNQISEAWKMAVKAQNQFIQQIKSLIIKLKAQP